VLTVILVEDSDIVRERLLELLDGEPRVRIVGQYEDADSAIEGIRNTNPHVVLLDIKLSGSNGMEVMRFVASQTSAPEVIVLTNYAEAQYRERFLAAGAMAVLDKSNEFHRVPELLRGLLGRPS
jgi:DNA-binding NarL/FixJ family response regulator